MTLPAETRFLRLPAVLDRSGLGRTALYMRIDAGTWPRPIKIGPNLNAWFEHELEEMNRAAAAGYSVTQLAALVRQLEEDRTAARAR